jgi:hypothetical protein
MGVGIKKNEGSDKFANGGNFNKSSDFIVDNNIFIQK